MNMKDEKSAIKEVVNRLLDSEKGFQEIAKATTKMSLKDMANAYANERRNMRQVLETNLARLGGEIPDKDTSFASSIHRAWIDIKISGWGDDFVSVVDEIERGSSVLIKDYQNALEKLNPLSNLFLLMTRQQEQINLELNELRKFRKEVEAVEA